MSAPFWCGTQAHDWEYRNCTDCKHGDRGRPNAEYAWDRCKIRDAVTEAHFGAWDETQSAAMGYDGGIYPPEWCASRERRELPRRKGGTTRAQLDALFRADPHIEEDAS